MDLLVIIKALSFLTILILCAYGCFLIMKKQIHQKSNTLGQRITVLSYKQVDQKLTVSLIDADGQKILIASNGDAISLIAINDRIHKE